MKNVCVLQHVEAEYLGLIEEHLESRAIRFGYCRPFARGGRTPENAGDWDGLILLGAGPFGIVSGPLLPSLGAELRLTHDFLDKGLPVVGIGVGAIILAVAAGGGAIEAPLRFVVSTATRLAADGLGGNVPERFPIATYMRDRPVLPESATILAEDEAGEPAVFAIGKNAFGFLGHPGIKSAMIEDLIMEFEEVADDTGEGLARLRASQSAFANALDTMMIGIVRQAGWMATMTPDPEASGT